MSYEELELSTAIGNPTVKEWKTANEVIGKIKENKVQIEYSRLKENKWYISVFMDTRRMPDGLSSVTGTLTFLTSGYRPQQKKGCCILSWVTSKVTKQRHWFCQKGWKRLWP